MLSRLAAALLAPDGDWARAAPIAIAQRLAGLCLPEVPAGATRTALARAALIEAGDHAESARERIEVLDALGAAGLIPLVMKGQPLAEEAWGTAVWRPPGDLDLLLPEALLEPATAILLGRGFSRAPSEPDGLLRAPPTGIELVPPAGKRLGVDLHARLFRSVGRRIDADRVLERAREGQVDGRPARLFDPADQLLYVYVHAAKHGVRALKWLLDLAALAARTDDATFHRAAARALATGTARPFHAAARLAARLPEVRIPPGVLDATRPPRPLLRIYDRLFTVERSIAAQPLSARERYALELTLEPGLWQRARMAAGIAERLWSSATSRAGRR